MKLCKVLVATSIIGTMKHRRKKIIQGEHHKTVAATHKTGLNSHYFIKDTHSFQYKIPTKLRRAKLSMASCVITETQLAVTEDR